MNSSTLFDDGEHALFFVDENEFKLRQGIYVVYYRTQPVPKSKRIGIKEMSLILNRKKNLDRCFLGILSVSQDTVTFSRINTEWKMLLNKRNIEPYKHYDIKTGDLLSLGDFVCSLGLSEYDFPTQVEIITKKVRRSSECIADDFKNKSPISPKTEMDVVEMTSYSSSEMFVSVEKHDRPAKSKRFKLSLNKSRNLNNFHRRE